jgi:glutaredoxin 3
VVLVEMYVKTTCPYCYRAQRLLDEKGVEYEIYVLDFAAGQLREEMIERASGRTTVPQIFINGTHVGGCDDLYALDRQGKLEQLLAA